MDRLKNLDRAEELALQSLQILRDYNRRKLEASACKLLGEIYQNRSRQNASEVDPSAIQFLTTSLQIYRELGLTQKATEVEQLMQER